MILVTLGTQDKEFVRLLDDIQKQIDNKTIKDKVIVQAGFTKYKSDDMQIFDLIDRDEFANLMNKCDLVITHGGVGSILTAIKQGKKVIGCPRLSKYQEHVNDHQKQIVKNFYDMGYILMYNDGDDLGKIIKMSKSFKPKKYVSNTLNIVKIIDNFIENN